MGLAARIGRGVLWLLFAAALALLAALWAYRDVPAAELEARYTTMASKFIHIDGVRIHYRDEGSGPPLLLIHANFASLLSWDTVVPQLQDRYRVVRFDMTGHGLTGPDPSGDYSIERTVALTEKLVDALALRRFTIGGTSLGGTVAMHYAARHPDRVDRLVLLSPGALEGRAMQREGRRLPAAAGILEYITPRALTAYMIESRVGDPAKVSDQMIDRWYDMWMREGQRAAILARLNSYSSASIAEVTAKIRAPALILWGEANPQTPIAQAAELRAMLTGAAGVQTITYPGVGHMANEEAGEQIGRDIRAYLESPPDGPDAPRVSSATGRSTN
jgi:pimeloyl-ACP methyl ester carboxylesterase